MVEDTIIELTRSGNFENWSTAKVKTSRKDHGSKYNGDNISAGRTKRLATLDEAIARLHQMVVKHVKRNTDKYYDGAEDFNPRLHKIRDEDDYFRTIKMLSDKIRTVIKEGYEAYNGTLEGIRLNGDHVAFIKFEVERHFEQIPVIKINNNRTYDLLSDVEKLVIIEDKAINLETKVAEIEAHLTDINSIWHLSDKDLKDLQKQANILNEEMQKTLESLDRVILLDDQQGNLFFKRCV